MASGVVTEKEDATTTRDPSSLLSSVTMSMTSPTPYSSWRRSSSPTVPRTEQQPWSSPPTPTSLSRCRLQSLSLLSSPSPRSSPPPSFSTEHLALVGFTARLGTTVTNQDAEDTATREEARLLMSLMGKKMLDEGDGDGSYHPLSPVPTSYSASSSGGIDIGQRRQHPFVYSRSPSPESGGGIGQGRRRSVGGSYFSFVCPSLSIEPERAGHVAARPYASPIPRRMAIAVGGGGGGGGANACASSAGAMSAMPSLSTPSPLTPAQLFRRPLTVRGGGGGGGCTFGLGAEMAQAAEAVAINVMRSFGAAAEWRGRAWMQSLGDVLSLRERAAAMGRGERLKEELVMCAEGGEEDRQEPEEEEEENAGERDVDSEGQRRITSCASPPLRQADSQAGGTKYGAHSGTATPSPMSSEAEAETQSSSVASLEGGHLNEEDEYGDDEEEEEEEDGDGNGGDDEDENDDDDDDDTEEHKNEGEHEYEGDEQVGQDEDEEPSNELKVIFALARSVSHIQIKSVKTSFRVQAPTSAAVTTHPQPEAVAAAAATAAAATLSPPAERRSSSVSPPASASDDDANNGIILVSPFSGTPPPKKRRRFLQACASPSAQSSPPSSEALLPLLRRHNNRSGTPPTPTGSSGKKVSFLFDGRYCVERPVMFEALLRVSLPQEDGLQQEREVKLKASGYVRGTFRKSPPPSPSPDVEGGNVEGGENVAQGSGESDGAEVLCGVEVELDTDELALSVEQNSRLVVRLAAEAEMRACAAEAAAAAEEAAAAEDENEGDEEEEEDHNLHEHDHRVSVSYHQYDHHHQDPHPDQRNHPTAYFYGGGAPRAKEEVGRVVAAVVTPKHSAATSTTATTTTAAYASPPGSFSSAGSIGTSDEIAMPPPSYPHQRHNDQVLRAAATVATATTQDPCSSGYLLSPGSEGTAASQVSGVAGGCGFVSSTSSSAPTLPFVSPSPPGSAAAIEAVGSYDDSYHHPAAAAEADASEKTDRKNDGNASASVPTRPLPTLRTTSFASPASISSSHSSGRHGGGVTSLPTLVKVACAMADDSRYAKM